MRAFLTSIDRLLRGQFTRREDLLAGRITIPTATLVTAAVLLGATYGAFMGIFAVMREDNPSAPQLFATIVKVPLLFLATLVVTFPSLYVFSALANSRLRGLDTLRLLAAAIAVNLALLASFGPITGFFTLSTSSYPFLVVLNVVFFGIAGVAGLAFLRRALGFLFQPDGPPESPAAGPVAGGAPRPDRTAESGETAPPPPLSVQLARQRQATGAGERIFRVWIVTYALVGAQMAWILRPFIGTPTLEFTFFRPRDSNFFEGLWDALRALFT